MTKGHDLRRLRQPAADGTVRLDQEAHAGDRPLDTAFRELAGQDVGNLPQLEVVVRVDRQRLVGVLDARIRPLEVEPRGDFLVGLVQCIADLDLVHFGNDVKRRHGGLRRYGLFRA